MDNNTAPPTSTPGSSDLFSRQEILAGLTERRARMALFAIEARTAFLADQSRQAANRFLTQEAAQEREMAYLQAFSQAKPPPRKPTIQELERIAPQWGALIPETPRLRAALAHALGQKYAFTRRSVPNIRRVLELDSPETQQAFRRLYQQTPDSIYVAQTSPLEGLRWGWAKLAERLEHLPPFWMAFALTLTETVGGGILALPIALAGLGPIPGVILLVIIGLLNLLTVAQYAEAITRSGAIRYGQTYMGRVAQDYLGRAGAQILWLAMLALVILILLAYYLGFSLTMEAATRVPASIWIAGLFAIGLYVLAANRLNMTAALSLLVGMVNIIILLALSALGLRYLNPQYLAYSNMPFVDGRPFDPSILGLVFGVLMFVYFGHMSVSVCARDALKVDPGGKSLMGGVVAAQIAAIVLYTLFTLAINGSLDPQALAAEPGTALPLLARQTGSAAGMLGSLFVILAMGLSIIQTPFVIFNLVRERLPRRQRPQITLPALKGRLLLTSADKKTRLGLTYLGLDLSVRSGEPPLRLRLEWQREDRSRQIEFTVQEHWDSSHLHEHWPELAAAPSGLALDVVQRSPRSASLHIDTSLRPAYQGEWDTTNLGMAGLLDLAPEQRKLVTWLLREGPACLDDLCDCLGIDAESAQEILALLEDEGLICETCEDNQTLYRVMLRPRRGVRTVVEKAEQKPKGMESKPSGVAKDARGKLVEAVGEIWRNLVTSERGQLAISLSPLCLLFLIAEWAALTGNSSFSSVLSISGALLMPLMAGIYPALLLVAARRKGERLPGKVYRALGHPLLLGLIFLLNLASMFIHGLFIWEAPLERLLAAGMGLLTLGITISMARKGAFARRQSLEVRLEAPAAGQPARVIFNSLACGQPGPVQVSWQPAPPAEPVHAAAGQLPELPALGSLTFRLPAADVDEIAVWAHRVTEDNHSEALRGAVELHRASSTPAASDLPLSSGSLALAHDGSECVVNVAFDPPQSTRMEFGC